jgi:hypothetical protein
MNMVMRLQSDGAWRQSDMKLRKYSEFTIRERRLLWGWFGLMVAMGLIVVVRGVIFLLNGRPR